MRVTPPTRHGKIRRMAWAPPDAQSDLIVQQIITRAREQALNAFSDDRRRIEREQAAKGVLGGPVLKRCGESAETAIRGFGARVVPELLDVLNEICGGPPSAEALEWVRTTVHSQIDDLVTGLGGQIDGLKTGARVKGAAGRLQPAGSAAKRDVEIEVSRAGIRGRVARPRTAPTTLPARLGAARGMYSLLVSGQSSAWSGAPFLLEQERFLEFTDDEVKNWLGDFSDAAIASLLRLPCVFAYEDICKKDPLFGVVRRVLPRGRHVRIEYDIVPVKPFLTQHEFRGLGSDLGTQDFEFHHTHWAVKEIDLARALASAGVTLPPADMWRPQVDVTAHHFDVGLSFPGEVRPFVKEVAAHLEQHLGPDAYFYDDNYTGQLARPDLDILLQGIYRNRSALVVVFLCAAYERKEWCAGVEFRAVRDIIKSRDRARVMYIRMDDAAVNGVFSIDGAVDGRRYSPEAIARMIKQRVDLLPR